MVSDFQMNTPEPEISNAKPPTHAGAVVYRQILTGAEFLIIRPKRGLDEWVFPKGHIEPGEEPSAAAIREVREEAGVTVELGIDARLGQITYTQSGEELRVLFFLGRCTRDGLASEDRQKRWVAGEQAEALLTHEESKMVLRWARERLQIKDENSGLA